MDGNISFSGFLRVGPDCQSLVALYAQSTVSDSHENVGMFEEKGTDSVFEKMYNSLLKGKRVNGKSKWCMFIAIYHHVCMTRRYHNRFATPPGVSTQEWYH